MLPHRLHLLPHRRRSADSVYRHSSHEQTRLAGLGAPRGRQLGMTVDQMDDLVAMSAQASSARTLQRQRTYATPAAQREGYAPPA